METILVGPLGSPVVFGEVSPNVYVVPGHRLPELSARVEKLNRRAKKAGGGIEVSVTEYACEVLETLFGKRHPTGRVAIAATVRLGGVVPKINGWAFVAKVEHHAEIGNIVARAPGYEAHALPESLRTADPNCDHCNTVRRRNDTFVLVDPAGVQKRIGRNCLADFLRTEDVSAALAIWRLFYELRAELSEYGDDWGGSGFSLPGVRSFLAATSSAIRHEGWVSSGVARDYGKTATKDTASWIVGKRPREPQALIERWEALQPSPKDVEEAEAVIGWAEELGGREHVSDYLHNLRVSIALGYVDHKHAGLVASAVVAYRKEKEIEIERQKRVARPPSTYFGTIKARYTFDALEVVAVRYIEGNYGVKTLLVLADAEGHVFKWFASGEREFAKGDVVKGNGTIKAHETYKDNKETLLTRCAFEKVETKEEAKAS